MKYAVLIYGTDPELEPWEVVNPGGAVYGPYNSKDQALQAAYKLTEKQKAEFDDEDDDFSLDITPIVDGVEFADEVYQVVEMNK